MLPQFGHQVFGDGGELGLGVTVGRGRIAIDGAEVAMAVDERQPHDPILRQADQGFVNGDVAVRVIFADDVADDAGALAGPAIGVQMQLVVHRVEDAALHRLEAVADVGQGAGGDDGQGIRQVAAARFLHDRRRMNRFRHQPDTPNSKGLPVVEQSNCSKSLRNAEGR